MPLVVCVVASAFSVAFRLLSGPHGRLYYHAIPPFYRTLHGLGYATRSRNGYRFDYPAVWRARMIQLYTGL
jgi:hypothetical protein